MSSRYKKTVNGYLLTVVLCALIVGLIDIYVHVKWWIGWTTFFVTVGTFCSFALSTFLSTFITSLFLPNWDDDDDKILFVCAETLFAGFASIPLWYLYAYKSGISNFWSVWMPVVSVGVPFALNLVIFRKIATASREDREAKTVLVNEYKRKWGDLLLGKDGCSNFRALVEQRRQDINIRYAKYACMRQVFRFGNIDFSLVDAFVEKFSDILSGKNWWYGHIHNGNSLHFVENFRGNSAENFWICREWNFNIEKPTPSFAVFNTVIKIDGSFYSVAIKILVTGECLLYMYNEREDENEGAEKEFKSWDEMLKFLDKKIGLES